MNAFNTTARLPNRIQKMNDDTVECIVLLKGIKFSAFFLTNSVSRIAYINDSGSDNAGVAAFLNSNAPDTTWNGPTRDSTTAIRFHSSSRIPVTMGKLSLIGFVPGWREEGIPLWQDRVRMEGGRNWWLQITEALKEVGFMVLVMTPNALCSPSIRKEWRYARQ
jgi:hypothetical protein